METFKSDSALTPQNWKLYSTITYVLLNSLVSSCFLGFLEKKRLNARDFEQEFLFG